MEIIETKHDLFVALEINGRLDTTNYRQAEKKINEVIDKNDNLLVDMTGIAYISSSGLRVMLAALKRLKSQNRKMVLCGLQSEILNVFSTTGFTNFFKIVDTLEKAKSAFN